MDTKQSNRRSEWRFEEPLLVILYITLLIIQCSCQTVPIQSSQITKRELINVDNKIDNECHNCLSNNYNKTDVKEQDNSRKETLMDKIVDTVSSFTEENSILNTTANLMADVLENLIEKVLTEERYVITDGIEITAVNEDKNGTVSEPQLGELEGRALFSKYTYEYRLLQKVKSFFATHAISINLPKAAKLMDFRSFGLNKFFVPLLIGGQIILKSILFTMFLPSILGSFGKILGKGISQLSASSSQASYPPAQMDEQSGYNLDNKDIMGYETNPPGSYVYPQDDVYGNMPENDVNDPENDMSRFGMGGQKASYLPGKNSYYKNQMATANNYKVFQKIPSSSMILSNYDPFYSPLLSRLDGIFARLGLTPSEGSDANHMQQIGGQSLSEVKLEACREQLICLMYANPAKYAPYSNLISAQLSRELNELRRPVSDNPEILRFFRYMRAARRGQEGTDCMRAHPACSTNTAPEHTMIAAYHDINKLVTARKMKSFWDWF